MVKQNCLICGRRIYTQNGLIYHVIWHHTVSPDQNRGYNMKKKSDRPYQCWMCGETFKHFIQLKKHIRAGIHGTPEEQHNQRVQRKRNKIQREHR